MWSTINAYLIDRDGVLVQSPGCRDVPGARNWINTLVSKKIPFLIATNHTLSSPENAANELIRAGFNIQNDQVHSPLTVLLDYFSQEDPGRVFVLGTGQLCEFLKRNHISVTTSSNADTVLMGFSQTLQQTALRHAIITIIKNNARLIALHKNRVYIDGNGNIEPGLGAWVQMIEYATGSTAMIVGKPNPYYFHAALDSLKTHPHNAVMISDDPTTDLVGARKVGLKTVFVTSGKYPNTSILDSIHPGHHPDIVLDSIADIPLA